MGPHFPFLGVNHWGLRHCIVLPMAALFGLFGQSETTLVLPSVTYAVGLIALLGYMAWRLHGWLACAIAVVIAGTIPVIATGATLISTDVPEAFFVAASLWAFYRGIHAPRPAMLVWSGVLAGIALLTRETSVSLIVLYGVLFLFGYGRDRRAYFWLGLGAAIPVGLDWLYLTSFSGDPLYRLHASLKGVQGDGPQMEAVIGKQGGLDRFGTLDVSRWLKPFAGTLANQNFGLFLWLAVPATVWLIVRGPMRVRAGAALIGGLALVWFLVIGYVLMHWLWVIPRYYAALAVLTVPLAIALAHAMSVGRTWLALAVVVLVVGIRHDPEPWGDHRSNGGGARAGGVRAQHDGDNPNRPGDRARRALAARPRRRGRPGVSRSTPGGFALFFQQPAPSRAAAGLASARTAARLDARPNVRHAAEMDPLPGHDIWACAHPSVGPGHETGSSAARDRRLPCTGGLTRSISWRACWVSCLSYRSTATAAAIADPRGRTRQAASGVASQANSQSINRVVAHVRGNCGRGDCGQPPSPASVAG